MATPISAIDDIANIRAIPAAIAANPGSIAIENISGTGLVEVDDQGVATAIGTGAGGITQLTGDVTAGPGSGSKAATIATAAVTLAKMANIATARFIGRVTAATGVPEAMTGTQATTLLDAATTSLQGAMSAADKLLSNDLASDWATAQHEFMANSIGITGLNQGRTMTFRNNFTPSVTVPSANDPATEGGGLYCNDNSAQTFLSQSLFQTPKTGKWAITFRGAFLGAGASGHVVAMCIYNAAKTHAWTIQRNTTFATHYGISLIGTSTDNTGVGTSAADSNIHNFTLAFDGTAGTPTCKLYVDHVLDASTTTVSQMADEPLYATFFSQTVKEAILTDIAFRFAATP